MRPKRLPFAVMLLVLTWTAAPRADSTDEYVARAMKAFHLPGLALLVVRDGQVAKAAGYGFADIERKTPVTPETVFMIGSISKQLIATGIMLLVQDGRLTVDDPVDAVTPADVRWACQLLSRLSERQWREAFRAAQYDEPRATRFISKIKEKIAQGLALTAPPMS